MLRWHFEILCRLGNCCALRFINNSQIHSKTFGGGFGIWRSRNVLLAQIHRFEYTFHVEIMCFANCNNNLEIWIGTSDGCKHILTEASEHNQIQQIHNHSLRIMNKFEFRQSFASILIEIFVEKYERLLCAH